MPRTRTGAVMPTATVEAPPAVTITLTIADREASWSFSGTPPFSYLRLQTSGSPSGPWTNREYFGIADMPANVEAYLYVCIRVSAAYPAAYDPVEPHSNAEYVD